MSCLSCPHLQSASAMGTGVSEGPCTAVIKCMKNCSDVRIYALSSRINSWRQFSQQEVSIACYASEVLIYQLQSCSPMEALQVQHNNGVRLSFGSSYTRWLLIFGVCMLIKGRNPMIWWSMWFSDSLSEALSSINERRFDGRASVIWSS